MKKSNRVTSISNKSVKDDGHAILRYLKRRHAALLDAHRRTQRCFAIEGIHDLRVEIKKIRALLRLAEQIRPEFKSRPPIRKLRALFRAAGSLRDIDIEQKIILDKQGHFELSEIVNYLKAKEIKQRKKLAGACDILDRRDLSKSQSQLRQALRGTTVTDLREPMRAAVKKLADDIMALDNRKELTSDHLHSVRKLSKLMRYELDVWQRCFGETVMVKSIQRGLAAVYNKLGEWRDTLLTLALLDSYLKENAPESFFDRGSYMRFRRELRQKSRLLLGEYREAWIELLPKLKKINRLDAAKTKHSGRVLSVAAIERTG